MSIFRRIEPELADLYRFNYFGKNAVVSGTKKFSLNKEEFSAKHTIFPWLVLAHPKGLGSKILKVGLYIDVVYVVCRISKR